MLEKYYVLRIYDDAGDECQTCKIQEKRANSAGGIEFSQDVITRGMKRGFYTDLFHDGCRCRLLPAPDGVPIMDALDRELLIYGSLFHNSSLDMEMDEKMEIRGKYGAN